MVFSVKFFILLVWPLACHNLKQFFFWINTYTLITVIHRRWNISGFFPFILQNAYVLLIFFMKKIMQSNKNWMKHSQDYCKNNEYGKDLARVQVNHWFIIWCSLNIVMINWSFMSPQVNFFYNLCLNLPWLWNCVGGLIPLI